MTTKAKATMRLFDFQSEAEEHIYRLRKLFEKLPSKGQKEEDCQRLCLLNALSDVEHCVNGTTQDDMTRA
jgi:hypothetical protein